MPSRKPAARAKGKPSRAAAGRLEDTPLFHAKDRPAWRAWLERNHARLPRVWLVSYRKGTGVGNVTYEEAVEEALAFGWIDSQARTFDARRRGQLFSQRRPGSAWAATNKARVARLLAAGLMTPAGLAKVEAAKRDGSWTVLDGVEALEVPGDLARALAGNAAARRHFDAFPPSSRKIILFWIASAKKPETRSARVAETARLAARNVRANHPGR